MTSSNLLWQAECFKLYVLKFGKLYNNTGVFVNESTKEAFIIDSPYGSFQGLKNSILRDFSIAALFITHAHWDHIGDDYLFEQSGTKVYVHPNGRKIVEDPKIIIPYTKCSFGLHSCCVEREIMDDEHIISAGTEIVANWVDGHSESDMSFYIKHAGVVFVGDTVFRDSIGRYDFIDSNKEQLIINIKKKILSLPEDTIIVPGHGELTTVKHELMNNIFLKN